MLWSRRSGFSLSISNKNYLNWWWLRTLNKMELIIVIANSMNIQISSRNACARMAWCALMNCALAPSVKIRIIFIEGTMMLIYIFNYSTCDIFSRVWPLSGNNPKSSYLGPEWNINLKKSETCAVSFMSQDLSVAIY